MGYIPPIAISVRQPWAWAIINAGKDVENRSKHAITLGRMDQHKHIAIHASKGMTRDEYETAARFMDSINIVVPRPDKLDRGSLIGAVSITGITKTSASPWFFGPWALELEGAESFHPIPASGQLGAFKWKRDDNAFAEPLPWMRAWPESAARTHVRATALPLFDECEGQAQ